ncbi:Mammalian cell entry related domain protein OS=Tsukamurella paurometabola (strain ATCC 8368 / DSM / CCUG 35730 / CIP 100753 / JCM 10117 / KCTC 9821 / NBRC 16120 / NCIMB 702349 / NCTC 13040) OX=521096 GN=Tpau_1244 PE=4 SV=1 [Tsukamurella paurometabola]|uniref:Mammalian cell entry related domain protein n=1 Tax=Tsukamurella paurometabola (strain ATCC 8368 / DSM 20162 / CCUG 35730 / CIP 100753 / JCM 10117 / KCTC 9821 / NBRC 16120 / NCIMB 702349 / NCTC 13040) TaxID=521096 RepID=D5UW68_TSUPD|nr:MlaD family protein [Tsukamurella paurometabola]ADG77875.1 Mammalian cell entry related domain protein [Tsukamurella paurometabola DSM 20162]SUP29159.1 virulence factor Mce family protein [Tsukamurella paurometabola]
MGVVSVPGMSIDRPVLRRRGLIAAAVILVIALIVWIAQAVWPKDEFSFTLRTPTVAAGIVNGAPVRIQGVQVGEVTGVKAVSSGQQGVTVTMKSADGKSLTNNVEAAFSAGNLFGVSEVILTPRDGGGELKDGATISPTKQITDNTVSNMIVTIGDVNNDALRPNMSTILLNFDASSKAMLPLFTALGNVAQAVQDTQRLTTAQTFPVITDTLMGADSAIAQIIPSVRTLFNYAPVHDKGWVNRGAATLDAITNQKDSLSAALQKLLDAKALKGLETATPMLVNLMQPLLNAFPNGSATGVGIQIGQLLDNVRKAMPNTPNGPVLNVRLSVDFPAIAAGLPPAPTFTYVPPNPGAKPGDAKPSAKPAAGSSTATPSTPTPKPGS